ncbi:hypothetical protein GOODEAATRI_001925 [Goodea atripinnis]|uniref:Centrosomin N-terminal motif 1 domain-containing protein n=1 Tax=Goodea atripinnis TaxID=208336 RepID=A0ABV0MPS8_9TELE
MARRRRRRAQLENVKIAGIKELLLLDSLILLLIMLLQMGTAEPPAVPAIMSNSGFRGYRTISQHLNDLKKENFSLKLRIYFLEEKIQQKFEESSDDVHRRVARDKAQQMASLADSEAQRCLALEREMVEMMEENGDLGRLHSQKTLTDKDR